MLSYMQVHKILIFDLFLLYCLLDFLPFFVPSLQGSAQSPKSRLPILMLDHQNHENHNRNYMPEEKQYALGHGTLTIALIRLFTFSPVKEASAGCLYPDHQKQREIPTRAPTSHPNFHRIPSFSSKDLLQGCFNFYS